MSKENAAASEAKEEKSGLRIAQVMAAALAAVTAALLGSTLGVAGTVAGAGVASVITTVGGELYLRSLQRTRAAALKARQLAASGIRRRGGTGAGAEVALAEQPTVQLPKPGEDPEAPSRLRKLRWPLIIGTSVAAFAVAILAIVGFESATGTQIGGGTGSSIGKIFGSGGGHPDTTPSTTPSTSSTNDTQESPTNTPSTTTETTAPPTTSTGSPTTTPTTPSTTAQQPTTSAAPPTSQGAAATPTP
ncbi:hypothetical protein QRX60_15765 [Amycolatopsis mongoliensis]|uniref:Uncharacterized protein n=1 Tax=Amycolatopsis mongoliensis TaxID=715475 RepID=A0A9Y2JV60_9PSEU|nr:hypothetical protein [Amycolatopsis sp. 4-36]WIY05225.1 hypothetical protein QRX60_15765 [Amycolatopsis sp. 4-36]